MLYPVLGEVIAIIEVTVALTIAGIALFGSPALSERAFRLLRWIRNQPEPQAPASGHLGNDGVHELSNLADVDTPLIGDGTNDVQAVVPGRIDHALVPGTAVVLDLNLGVKVRTDDGPDGEGAAWQARAAVHGGVGSEFGGAQDHVVCPGAVTEDRSQVGTDSADVLGAAWIGDLAGACCECPGCWRMHKSLTAAPSTASTRA
jgi:hypothetical protein